MSGGCGPEVLPLPATPSACELTGITAGTSSLPCPEALSFADSPSVSFGLSGSTVTASTPLDLDAISAAGGLISSGTAVFANSPTVSFGVAGQTITASAAGGAAAGLAAASAGTDMMTSGTLSFLNGSGVTFGLDSGPGGGTLTASIAVDIDALTAAGGGISSGTASFADSNGVSFGIAGQTITANFSSLVFSNSNNVTFGTAGSTVTASVGGMGALSGTYWDNAQAASMTVLNEAGGQNLMLVGPLIAEVNAFPYDMTASTFGYNFSISGAAGVISLAFTSTIYVGIYTATADSLSLLNSASSSYGFAAPGLSNSTAFAGQRFFTFGTGAWSSLPVFTKGGQYYLATFFRTSGTSLATLGVYGMTRYIAGSSRSGTVGISQVSGSSLGFGANYGLYSTSLSSFLGSVANSQLGKVNQGDFLVPHVYIMANTALASF